MVHLRPLPGSPRFDGDFDGVIRDAVADAKALAEAGFPALMIENFGDVPFYASAVRPITVAALTRAAEAIRQSSSLPFGVNVLRNDALSSLAVAATTGASWIRVNVLSGLMNTDQGPIIGQAADIARTRAHWCPAVQILADVMVKHASPPPGLTIEQAGLDTFERAGADALIVSGAGTGVAPELEDGRRLRKALPKAPILVGSGATVANLAQLAEFADGVIVGSALKRDGLATNPVDPQLADRFRKAAAGVGW
jgi:membrane complex biogenesis BtpA family protein